MITLGSVHINYIVVSTYEIHQMHIACYRCLHMRSIPDAYCMLQVLLHEKCTRCILYIRSLLLLILTVGTKRYCYSTYLSRLCFSDIDRFCWIWFFSFLLSYLQFGLLCNWCCSRWVLVGEFCCPFDPHNVGSVDCSLSM